MKRVIKSLVLPVLLIATFFAASLSLSFITIDTALAQGVGACKTDAGKESDVCKTTLQSLVGPGSIIQRIINVLLFAIGVISVIVIIIAGFRFVVADGDSQKITQAKYTIIYAVIGLVVAVSAYAIVNFVLTALG